MLPFQVLSSFFSSANWLLVREVWRECVPVAAAMDGTERAGRRLEESVFPASLRDRCWRTLIMASFSMILAWRFLMLCNKRNETIIIRSHLASKLEMFLSGCPRHLIYISG